MKADQLFPVVGERSNEPKRETEPIGAFIARAKSADSRRIRDLLAEWVSAYPEAEKIQQRILASQRGSPVTADCAFHSAFFELLLHRLLTVSAATIDIEPQVPGYKGRPDLVISFPGESPVLLEATVLMELGSSTAEHAIERVVREALYQIPMGSVMLSLDNVFPGDTSRPPSAGKMRRMVESELRVLEEHLRRHGSLEGRDLIEAADRGWRIRLHASPSPPEPEGDEPIPALVFHSEGEKWGTFYYEVGNKLREKAQKVGDCGLPSVVAVNVLSEFFFSPSDYRDPLFGPRGEALRHLPGFFVDYTRVSGVLLATHLTPWTLGRTRLIYASNPHTTRPFDLKLPALAVGELAEDGKFTWSGGVPLGHVFQLYEDWPRERQPL